MGRSLKKGPFVEAKLLKKVLKQKETGDRSTIKTWSRRCTIVPEFVNHTFEVHNGKMFIKVFVVEANENVSADISRCLGEALLNFVFEAFEV